MAGHETDFNDSDPTQWKDTDGDGFGDNYDNMNWSEVEHSGKFVEGATQPDRCPNEYSAFLYSDTQGCLTTPQSPDGTEQNAAESKDDEEESNLVHSFISSNWNIFVLFMVLSQFCLGRNHLQKRVTKLDLSIRHWTMMNLNQM